MMDARSWLWRLTAATLLGLAACVGDSTAGLDGSSPPLVVSAPPGAPSSTPGRTHTPGPDEGEGETGGPRCPGDPLRGVYHPDRLDVLGTCRWFGGAVTLVRLELDGITT